jgi:hypothetical protein
MTTEQDENRRPEKDGGVRFVVASFDLGASVDIQETQEKSTILILVMMDLDSLIFYTSKNLYFIQNQAISYR